MTSDIKQAMRSIVRHRTSTLVAVIILALGIGSAASVFSVSDWILFRARQFPHDVYLVGGQGNQGPFVPFRAAALADAYLDSNVMSEWARAMSITGNVVVDGQPVATAWLAVSTNFFQLLRIQPAIGRGFLPGEEVSGSGEAVVVSHDFWQRFLGGREDILGRTIIVGDSVCTVVGVLSRSQVLPAYFTNDVYRPLRFHADIPQSWYTQQFVLGRLQQGITQSQASDILSVVPATIPPFLTNDRPTLYRVADLNKLVRTEIYWVAIGAVAFLYAIACLNASNLMIVRMLGRHHEFCIRIALGGTRRRIIRLLVIESSTLAMIGSFGGLLVAYWLFPLLLTVSSNSTLPANSGTWHLDERIVAMMGLLTVATSIGIVAIPAINILRAGFNSGLKHGGGTVGEGPGMARVRAAFVVLQTGFAVVLLTGAGLMVQTFHQLRSVDLGFDPSHLVKVQLSFPAFDPTSSDVRLARLREVQTQLSRLPGVGAVGYGSDLLLPDYPAGGMSILGADGQPMYVQTGMFSIGYQTAAGLSLVRGRWISRSNGNEVMVNETLARIRWPGKDAVGQLLKPESENRSAGADWQGWEVVGVVRDIRASPRIPPQPYLYCPESWGILSMRTFIVRLTRDYDEALGGAIRHHLFTLDPRMVVQQVLSLAQARDRQLWAERIADSVLKVLAAIALFLTVIGLFSVLAYTVDLRMSEFGVRMAMGAQRRHLMGMVLRRGALLGALGLTVGMVGSLSVSRVLRSVMFETSALDPWVMGSVCGILLLASLLSSAIPAYWATKADITRLLRTE